MPGADIAVYEALADTLGDYHALTFGRPELDKCQDDWELIRSTAEDSFIAFQATRAASTGDPQDRDLFDDSDLSLPATPIIAAWGDEDELSFHGPNRTRGFARFYGPEGLQAGDVSNLEAESDGSFIVTAQNFTIPLEETTYHEFCINATDFENAPNLTEAVHIIGVDLESSADVNGVDTSKYVHHFALFGRSSTCDDQFTIPVFFYGWGPGQPPFILPSDVGLPLGGQNGFQSLGLEIHYDNVDKDENIVDSTGVRLYYSNEKRENEVNAMIVGDTFTRLRPQSVGSGKTQHTFDCPSSCSQSNLPGPVTIFSEAMHTHETATRTVNQIVRDGVVVHEAVVDFWDFRRAGIKHVQQERYELQPGDVFRTTCYYENSDNSTVFGLGTQEEMCQALLFYYPAISQSHGFCGPGLTEFLGDELCEASYMGTVQAEDDFGRAFGSPQEEECSTSPPSTATRGAASHVAAASLLLSFAVFISTA